MNRRHCLGALVSLGGTLRATPGAAQSMRRDWPAKKPTPALWLPAVDGAAWRLADEIGHAVLLNFWATWCEPCRAEMPSLARLAAAQRDAGLHVIAINYREGEPAVRRFLANTPIDLPVVRDPDGAAARAFGVNIFPSTVAVDRRGRARFIVVGEFEWDGTAGLDAIQALR